MHKHMCMHEHTYMHEHTAAMRLGIIFKSFLMIIGKKTIFNFDSCWSMNEHERALSIFAWAYLRKLCTCAFLGPNGSDVYMSENSQSNFGSIETMQNVLASMKFFLEFRNEIKIK